jgi:hypothetical protein
MARYDNGSVQSTPATEMVWWGVKDQEAQQAAGGEAKQ